MTAATAYVLLEDGTRFDGIAVGAADAATGEVVFTTGMSGYQESVSDPSFAGRTLRGRVLMTVAAGAVAYRERSTLLTQVGASDAHGAG